VYQGQKKSKEALPHFQEALKYTEISKGGKSLECVPVLRELAGAEQALGFHNAAISHFSQVRCNIWATKTMLDLMLFTNVSGTAALTVPGYVIYEREREREREERLREMLWELASLKSIANKLKTWTRVVCCSPEAEFLLLQEVSGVSRFRSLTE
jgi:hypothetical protein